MLKSRSLAFFFILCSAAFCGNIPSVEESDCFRKHINSQTQVVSYILDIPDFNKNRQSIYFTHKSMTDDGRFLLFHGSNDRKRSHKKLYVLDIANKRVSKLIDSALIPFLDTKTCQVYYMTRDGLYRHDLLKDPEISIKLADFPADIKKLGKIRHVCTHLTLTRDRKQVLLDMKINEYYIQGTLDIPTGKFTIWGKTDFFINHGQIHPFRNDLALCAWENLGGKKVKGVYPRLWLLQPGNKRTMIPPKINNYATHECWSEDGKGFYFCSNGVHYHDLATGKQQLIVPMNAAHASMTRDNKYVTFDCAVGNWYRGCEWKVGFYNRETGKGLYFYPGLAAYNQAHEPNYLHPDPHPQFVCNGKYIICTINSGSGNMDLSITPVDQLIKMTSK